MDELTEEEIELLQKEIVLIDNKQVTGILEELIRREVGMLSTDAGEDKSLRQIILWEIIALCSAMMQLRPGGWGLQDLELTPDRVESPDINPVQIETPEAETSEDQS